MGAPFIVTDGGDNWLQLPPLLRLMKVLPNGRPGSLWLANTVPRIPSVCVCIVYRATFTIANDFMWPVLFV